MQTLALRSPRLNSNLNSIESGTEAHQLAMLAMRRAKFQTTATSRAVRVSVAMVCHAKIGGARDRKTHHVPVAIYSNERVIQTFESDGEIERQKIAEKLESHMYLDWLLHQEFNVNFVRTSF